MTTASNTQPKIGTVKSFMPETIDLSTVQVTPEIAKNWLSNNKRNRNISQATIHRYESDMANGRWSFAADPIRFDTDGNLLDGQHRLIALACLEGVDITIPMVVVRGLQSESQYKMDQGRRRTTDQQLALKGVRNATIVAGGARLYLVWQNGLMFKDTKLAAQAVTTAYIEEWVENNDSKVGELAAMHSTIRKIDAAPSVAACVLFKLIDIDAEQCVEFFHLLATGAGTEGHPIVTLDKRLGRIRREKFKVSQRDYIAMFVQAWNAWRDGRPMSKLPRPHGGSWTEQNFPVPH